MAAEPLIAAMAPDCELPDGYLVRFNALDATTGVPVAGVIVENVSIFGTVLGTLDYTSSSYAPVLMRTRVSGG